MLEYFQDGVEHLEVFFDLLLEGDQGLCDLLLRLGDFVDGGLNVSIFQVFEAVEVFDLLFSLDLKILELYGDVVFLLN